MKIYKTLTLFMLLSSLITVTHAQYGFGKIEGFDEVQNCKLIVIKEEPMEKVIKKLKKNKESLDKYMADIENYNNNMKKVVEIFWPYKGNGIEYKTLAEAYELKKTSEDKYAVLQCVSKSATKIGNYETKDELSWSWTNTEKENNDKNYSDYFAAMSISLLEDLGKSPLSYSQLPDNFPTTIASLVFGIHMIENEINFRIKKNQEEGLKALSIIELFDDMLRKNAAKLENMNLLICEDLLDKKLTKESIKDYYPYKYTVCSKEELNDAIINKQENAAYIVIFPEVMVSSTINKENSIGTNYKYVLYNHYIFNTQNSELISYIKPGLFLDKSKGKSKVDKYIIERFVSTIKGEK